MALRLNRAAYQKLIDENLEWLMAQPRTLARQHIEAIVRRSVELEYGENGEQSPIDLNQRGSLERLIGGALKNAIQAHGPITTGNYPSAASRVISAIKHWNRGLRRAREEATEAKP